MPPLDLYKITQIELTYRRKVRANDRPKVQSSKTAADLFRENWNSAKMDLCEEFKILLLDRNGACMGIADICSGTVSEMLVDPKLIFGIALKARTCSIILGHNHPSGNLVPSKADIRLTRDLSEVGRLLNLNILDHIILTSESHYSMAEDGCMP